MKNIEKHRFNLKSSEVAGILNVKSDMVRKLVNLDSRMNAIRINGKQHKYWRAEVDRYVRYKTYRQEKDKKPYVLTKKKLLNILKDYPERIKSRDIKYILDIRTKGVLYEFVNSFESKELQSFKEGSSVLKDEFVEKLIEMQVYKEN